MAGQRLPEKQEKRAQSHRDFQDKGQIHLAHSDGQIKKKKEKTNKQTRETKESERISIRDVIGRSGCQANKSERKSSRHS